MKIQRTIHWNKLAQIRELKEFFAEDYQGFKKLIEAYMEELEKFSMEQAMTLVKKDYETLFSPYYIEREQKYIGAYLEAFE